MSVNDGRGPSVDNIFASAKGKRSGPGEERLAHRGCNTRKGAVTPVVAWPDHLFVIDPAPLLTTVERLTRRPGKEVVARCPTLADGHETAAWLVDRLSRLAPNLAVETSVEPGGGQFLIALNTRR